LYQGAAWGTRAYLRARRVAETVVGDESPENATDPMLCHGIAGQGHLLNRLYQCSGDEAFAAAATVSFKQCLRTRHPAGDGIGGFSALDPESGRCTLTSLMLGAPGLALSLLSAATPVAPGWDRIMLLSSQPSRERGA
jgi:hypothetical protein